MTLLLLTSSWLANAAQVENLRMWPAPDNTRLVFDVSEPAEYRMFPLTNPDRLVIDIHQSRLTGKLPAVSANDNLISRIRSAPRNKGDLRVVLDLKRPVKTRSFLLQPNRRYGDRLVIDLVDRNRKAAAKVVRKQVRKDLTELRDVVVAIDAGHGGEDPGAKGYRGTYEKDVVLKIARAMAREINARKGMKAVLIRRGDYYIGLRKRMKIARRHKADLFVSIHADAFKQPGVHGSSVYVLSGKGASSEAARWLAEKENAADLVGGVSLDDKDDLLASVLLDLSQTATLEASNSAAAQVLNGLRKLGKVHKNSVQHASFAVLKSPDIPSMLIETAFISNPHDERRLLSRKHQQALAREIVSGIHQYFRRHAPPGTILAAARDNVVASVSP